MKLTPLDILQQNFKKVVRGYDPKQVDAFLELVRGEWEAVLKTNQQIQDDLRRLTEQVSAYRSKEKTLQETLMTAQRLSDEVKQSAKKEADIVVGQAELEADKLIHQAHGRLTQVIDEINELKRQRAEFEAKLKSLIDTHLRLIELQKEARETVNLEDVRVIKAKA